MDNFYRYTADDFEQLPLSEIHEGDAISLNGPGKYYGVATIEYVVPQSGGSCVIGFVLPDEATIASSKTIDVYARWEDGKRVIRVDVYHEAGKILQIRRNHTGNVRYIDGGQFEEDA